MRRPTSVSGVLPRRSALALAGAGAAGALLVAGLATLPAAAAGSPGGINPAPQADPSPTGIVILPTTQAPPPSSEAPASTAPASTEPASTAPVTHSAAPTSGAAPTSHAPTSHAVASGTAHATSSAPVTTHTTSRAVTSSTGAGGSTSSGSTGGSSVQYYSGPIDLPTDLAASPGAVALVTSKAPGGKSVLVPATSTTISASDRKVGSFSLSSVLITTVVAAAIVALLGGVGLWLTRRFGTRLSQTDAT